MNQQDKKFIESVLKQTLYGVTENFIADILPDNQDASELSKDRIMAEAYQYVEKEVPKIIEKLQKNGIDSVADIETKSDIMTELVGKVETQMEENAKKLSET